MNVFDLRRKNVDEYADYIRSFIKVQDPRFSQQVDDELEGGPLWPEPLRQLNPSFQRPWLQTKWGEVGLPKLSDAVDPHSGARFLVAPGRGS